jgi:RHS repeat-associated protein
VIAGAQSCFPLLAAEPLSAASRGAFAPTRATSSRKTRARNLCPTASGRLSRQRRVRPIITPGLRACAYETASGQRQWLNRDPLRERGGLNLYRFVLNDPLNFTDSDGMSPLRYAPPPRPVEPLVRQIEMQLETTGYARPSEMLPRSVRQRMAEEFLARPRFFENTTLRSPRDTGARPKQLQLPLRPTIEDASRLVGTPCRPRSGRRGSPGTEQQLDEIRDRFLEQYPEFTHVFGGRDVETGRRIKEEYIPGPGGGRSGSSYPDLTFIGPNRFTVRVNTVDSTKSGVMTQRELDNFYSDYGADGAASDRCSKMQMNKPPVQL